jgi:hypothetical protein
MFRFRLHSATFYYVCSELLLKLMLVTHQVNKPTLPLASGEYSPATGVAIVSVSAAMVTSF